MSNLATFRAPQNISLPIQTAIEWGYIIVHFVCIAPLWETPILQKKIQHRKETQKSVENQSEFQKQTMASVLQGLISVWRGPTNDAALQKKHGLLHQPIPVV